MVPRYLDLPETFFRAVSAPGSVLLHSGKPDAVEHVSYLYASPVEVRTLHDPQEFEEFLAGLEVLRRKGYGLAGYTAYEAGYALVGVEDPPEIDGPLAWFGVYEGAWTFDHLTGEVSRVGRAAPALDGRVEALEAPDGSHLGDAGGSGGIDSEDVPATRTVGAARAPFDLGSFGLDEESYHRKLAMIRSYLSAGDTYQVNFTDRFEAHWPDDDAYEKGLSEHNPTEGGLLDHYRALMTGQPVSYGAYLNTEDLQVASLSPELFFRVDGREIVTRPMKGTTQRGRDNEEDAALAAVLRTDEKTRAENVMIVDLLRNDLGRVCRHGSVQVPELFSVERYRTVQQMTSTVTGTLREKVELPDLFAALFPCGSVTGAPKRRTMQLIRELERVPRGVYTGAIGHVVPSGSMAFSVAIRTVVQSGYAAGKRQDGEQEMRSRSPRRGRERPTRKVVLGAGGGIVADSDPAAEYRECLLKARFATHPGQPFELIETIRFDQGYRFLDAHLTRLHSSAGYFGFACDRDALHERLQARAMDFEPGVVYRVGVRLPASGEHRITAVPFQDGPDTDLRVAIAEERVDSRDPFLRHKTSNRELYRAARARADREGLAEILFLNERGELTEGTISNLFLEIDGRLVTPPVEAGALPGVYREHLLRTVFARESVLRLEDLHRADDVILVNSLRGARRARLV